jgi:hypothetical protein
VPVVPDVPLGAGAGAGVVPGVASFCAVVIGVAGVAPVAAGWLCANAGTAIAAENASSAQIILLMAIANALCFIIPLTLVSKARRCCAKRGLLDLSTLCTAKIRRIPSQAAPRVSSRTTTCHARGTAKPVGGYFVFSSTNVLLPDCAAFLSCQAGVGQLL